jgi:hypothetical protein
MAQAGPSAAAVLPKRTIVQDAELVLEAFMSPGALTERRCFFVAPYDRSQRKAAGGGNAACRANAKGL